MRARLTPTLLAVVSVLLVLGSPPPARATFAGSNGRIAFSYGDQFPGGDLGFHTDVFTIRPDGSHVQQLTHVPDDAAAALPSWSPDGTKIAFDSNVSGNYEIWVMDADGRNKTQITDEPRFEHLMPSWSPDGSRIVYSRCDTPFGFISFCDIARPAPGFVTSNPRECAIADRTLQHAREDAVEPFGLSYLPTDAMRAGPKPRPRAVQVWFGPQCM